MYTVNIRQTFWSEKTQHEWESGALLEETPQVSQTAQGWAGTLWLDGYPMRITPADTTLLTAPSGTQMNFRPFGPLGGMFSTPRMGTVLPRSPSPPPPFSASLFQPNTWAIYRGPGKVNDHILLDQLQLWPNQIDTKETEYWAQLAPAIHAPDYGKHNPGSIQFPHTHADKILKILPDQNVQDYVSNLGTTLIPQYQKALPETDATKIHFRFYVIQSGGTTFNNDFAISSPSGLILIPERTLTRIDNEAQLASILSYAITFVLQKSSYIIRYAVPENLYAASSTPPATPDLSSDAFALTRKEQVLRIGIRQMYLAGYDIREAPFAWAAAEGKPVVNPVTDPKDPNTDVPWDTAYAFDYISQYYKDVDYSKLKKGEAEYAQFLNELRSADPESFEKK